MVPGFPGGTWEWSTSKGLTLVCAVRTEGLSFSALWSPSWDILHLSDACLVGESGLLVALRGTHMQEVEKTLEVYHTSRSVCSPTNGMLLIPLHSKVRCSQCGRLMSTPNAAVQAGSL